MFGSRRIAATPLLFSIPRTSRTSPITLSFIVAHRMRIQLGLLRGHIKTGGRMGIQPGNVSHFSNVCLFGWLARFQRLTGPNMLNRSFLSVTLFRNSRAEPTKRLEFSYMG